MEKNIPVPYRSQYDDVEDEKWQKRSCGVTCIKMILDWTGISQDETIDDLIKEGLDNDAYIHDVGWKHDGLVYFLMNRGIPAYRREFKSRLSERLQEKLLDDGIGVIIHEVTNKGNPVIVSIDGNYWKKSDGHLIVCIGYHSETSEFIFHDPNSKQEVHKNVRMTEKDFRKYWRKMAIFVEKYNLYIDTC